MSKEVEVTEQTTEPTGKKATKQRNPRAVALGHMRAALIAASEGKIETSEVVRYGDGFMFFCTIDLGGKKETVIVGDGVQFLHCAARIAELFPLSVTPARA